MNTSADDGTVALDLALIEGAPEDLQSMGIKYWSLAGIDQYTEALIWEFKTNQLLFQHWSGTAHYAAAAGVLATALDYQCAKCNGLLTLTSRQALTDARQGKRVSCRSCNKTIDERASQIFAPGNKDRREKQSAEASMRRAEREAGLAADAQRRAMSAVLEDERRRTIIDAYAVTDKDSAAVLSSSDLQARVGALSILHAVGDHGGLIHPVNYADDALAPEPKLGRELFLAALHQDLLLIHPSSPTKAFVWTDGTARLEDGIYVDRAHFCVPGAGTLSGRLDAFANRLRSSLDLDSLWSTERDELQRLGQRIVAEEAARYFVRELQAHNLPDLTETHEEALRTHTSRGAGLFSLGHLYRMAWGSARDASSAHQRNKGMSQAKAVTHGLNQFDRWIQRAAEDPSILNDPFSESKEKLPLSAVTSVVFRTILDLDPMAASPVDVAEALADSPDEELLQACDDAIPEHHELIEWIRSTSQNWDVGEFRRLLARLEDWRPELCAPGCAHDRVSQVACEVGRVFDRVVARVGEVDASVLTAEATGVANAIRDGVRTGDAVLAELIRQLRGN